MKKYVLFSFIFVFHAIAIAQSSKLPDKMLRTGAATANFNKVKKALELGADVNCTDLYSTRNTALLLVTRIRGERKSQIDIVKLLIDKGANVNYVSRQGDFALRNSIMNHQPVIFEYLLKKSANPNMMYKKQLAPIHYAVAGNKFVFLKMLLENKADIHLKNGAGRTAFFMTAKGRRFPKLQIAKYLLSKNVDVNLQDVSGWTPLMKATEECNIQMMRFFINNGANLNVRSKKGYTALDIAEFQYSDVVKSKKGPDRKEWIQMYKDTLILLQKHKALKGKGYRR